jgi:glucose/arabinose dehydrogenase
MKELARKKLIPVSIILVILLAIALGVWLILHSINNTVQEVADTSKLSTTDPDLKLTDIVKDLNNPMAVAFPTQSSIIYGLRNGEVRGRLPATNEDWVLLTPAGIRTTDGFGLFSILADKEFSDNRYIYACYTTASDMRLTRYKIANDLKSVVETKDILTGVEVKSSKNTSCALTMDASGSIWIGTGDSEIATAPQNPKSLAGKILRISREGTASSGNLKAPFDDRIFSYGHRKVTAIVLLGRLLENKAYGYSIDQGSAKDELNYLKSGNFGYSSNGAVMTDKTQYQDAVDAVLTTDSALGMQGAVMIKQERWQAWQNKLLVTTPASNDARVIEFDEKGAFKSEKSVLKDRAGRIGNLIEAPDGTIYGTADNGNPDKIFQLRVVCTVCG